MATPQPRVFISHSSTDKARFVIAFGTYLRGKGIDAIVDEWEIRPGDSVVDKIFEEGIKTAAGMIVVLSPASVSSKWVREELNSGVVTRIEHGMRLIPVVIEACEVPQALKHLRWLSVPDLANFQEVADRIVDTFLGVDRTPPLQPAPAYAAAGTISVPGLAQLEALVLTVIANTVVSQGDRRVRFDYLVAELSKQDLSAVQVREAAELLDSNGHIELEPVVGGIRHVSLTPHGFDSCLPELIPDHEKLTYQIALLILNEHVGAGGKVAERLGAPLYFVNHVLEQFRDAGMLILSEERRVDRVVARVNSTLGRWVREQEAMGSP